MNLTDDAVIGALVTVLIAMAAGGWAILRLITTGMERRQSELTALIWERFEHAEQQRRESSEHWQRLFHENQRVHERHSSRLSTIEQRLVVLEHPTRDIRNIPS